MPTETIDQKLRRSLEPRRREWAELARLADVSYSWIAKFVAGKIPNPGIRTLEQLQIAVEEKPTMEQIQTAVALKRARIRPSEHAPAVPPEA